MKELAASDWRRILRSGARVFVGSGVSMPRLLVESMLEAAVPFEDIELVHALPVSPLPWLAEGSPEVVRTNTFSLNEELQDAVASGRADYTPCSLSEVPYLFTKRHLPLDVALIQVSPPNADGYCSLGANVDVVLSAVYSAKTTVAQINPATPRTNGDSWVHSSKIRYYLEDDRPLPTQPEPETTATAKRIGRYIAQIVEDGCTVHAAPGSIAQAALAGLSEHRHLGIHTSLFGTAMMRLVEAGAVDNSRKTLHRGKIVADHCAGTRELYDFIDDNRKLELHPSEYVDSPDCIGMNWRMVSINEAIAADLTGQVVCDSLGRSFYHGVSEQVDFLRGAALSKHGRPIVALASTTLDGKRSRIMASLTPGTGVAVGRVDVHYVVTEHGVATLYGRTVRDRVLEMIHIAHPDFREGLLKDARDRGWVPEFHVKPGFSPGLKGRERLDSREFKLGRRLMLLRPLQPKDVRRVQEFFYTHDPETVHLRYGHMLGRMSPGAAYQLANVDHHRDLALGIFELLGEVAVLRAMASYYLDDDGTSAEIAFVVDEKWRRKGLATRLIEAMAKVASRRGVRRFWAQVSRENRPMLALFAKHDARREEIPGEPESVEVTLEVDQLNR